MPLQTMDEKAIFNLARCIDVSEARAEYLKQVCGPDPKLFSRVVALLEIHEQERTFLELPAIAENPAAGTPSPERPGTQIGPYKLLEQIGTGGMGDVYVAEQKEPVRRKVALKVIKPGMDTRQVVARFEAERQALAMMNHPNIAKVLDAGATDAGRPYFVMELVKGAPITEFCDQQKLDTRERLQLFISVCQAVQHAHHKGLIHRDIKPSNVLVEVHDVTPVPKVIDFGVAKAIGQSLTEKTLHTGFGEIVGTPMYMSPEQAGQSSIDVDTRSDIYSLGVLLYEILTGHTPFERDTLRNAGFDEMRRIIREVDPPRPSARVSTLEAKALSTLSDCRKVGPGKLSQQLRGELDWIVMKALEKDRNRRYESANALAADVQRYLDDEPVEACPPSAIYRIQKYARRHKGLLAVSVAMLTGTVFSLWQAVEAKQSRTEAIEQRNDAEKNLKLAREQATEATKARAEAVEQRQDAEQNLELAREAADNLLKQISGTTVPRSPQFDGVRRAVLQESIGFYQRLLAQKGKTPAVRFSTARAWRRIGEVEYDLLNFDEGIAAFEKSFALLEKLVAQDPVEPSYMSELASGHQALVSFEELHRDRSRKQKDLTRARDLLQVLTRLQPQQPEHAWQLTTVQAELDVIEGGAGDESWHRQRAEAARAFTTQHPENLNWRRNFASVQMELASFLVGHGGQEIEIEGLFDNSIEVVQQFLREGVNERDSRFLLAEYLQSKASWLWSRGQVARAETLFRESLAYYDDFFRRLQLGHHDEALRAARRIEFGELLEKQQRVTEAEQLYQVALDDLTYPGWGQCWSAVSHLAVLLLKQQRHDAAAEQLAKYVACSLDIFRQTEREHEREYLVIAELMRAEAAQEQVVSVGAAIAKLDLPPSDESDKQLAETLVRLIFDRGQYATPTFPRTVMAIAEWGTELAPDKVRQNAPALNNLAWSLATCPDAKSRDATHAFQLARKAVELAPSDGALWNTLGVCLCGAGDWKAAVTALEKSMELRNGGDSSDWFFLAMANWQLGNKVQARKWYDQAVAWMDKNKPEDEELHRFRAEAAELLRLEVPATLKE